jgi:hypothetical protein
VKRVRPLLVCAATLAGIGLGTVLWLGRPSRGGAQLEHGLEPAVEQGRPAAELVAGGAPEEAQRTAVEIEALPVVAKPQPAAAPASESESSGPTVETTAELTVLVLGEEDGAPLAGVSIFDQPWPVQPFPEDYSKEATRTGEDGRVTLHLPAGGTRIYEVSQADRELIVELAAGEKRDAVLRLRSHADQDFVLLILDAGSGKPLPGAHVDVESFGFPEEWIAGAKGSAIADERGFAELRLSAWLALTGEVTCPGYSPLGVPLEGSHTDREHALQVLLARGARLEGLVVDGSGAPLAGASVTGKMLEWGASNPNLVMGNLSWPAEQKWTCKTGADGRYALLELPPGIDLGLQLHHAKRLIMEVPEALRLEPGEVRVRDFRVEPPGRIRGVVLDAAGEPVKRQALWLVPGSEARMLYTLDDPVGEAATDDKGRFSFELVPPGTWLVGLAPEELDVNARQLAQVIELPPGVPEIEVVLRLPAGLLVSGRCVGPAGEPMGGASMTAFGGGVSAGGTSKADGAFVLGPFPPGKVYVGAAELRGYAPEDRWVQAGDSDIVLLFAPVAHIRGTVVDAASGASLAAEVLVWFKPSGGPDRFMISGTDKSGAFDLSGFPGRWVLVARTSSGLVSPPRAANVDFVEAVMLELRVAPGGRARVLLSEGDWIRIRADGDLVDVSSDPLTGKKEWTSHPFRPGAFTVELMDREGNQLATREATVAAGEVVEVDLR